MGGEAIRSDIGLPLLCDPLASPTTSSTSAPGCRMPTTGHRGNRRGPEGTTVTRSAAEHVLATPAYRVQAQALAGRMTEEHLETAGVDALELLASREKSTAAA